MLIRHSGFDATSSGCVRHIKGNGLSSTSLDWHFWYTKRRSRSNPLAVSMRSAYCSVRCIEAGSMSKVSHLSTFSSLRCIETWKYPSTKRSIKFGSTIESAGRQRVTAVHALDLLASVDSSLGIKLDASILMASVTSSIKLFSLCSFIVWLQKSGHLPESTPSVLSKVAYQAVIPCFLMSRSAATLSAEPVGGLFLLPMVALFQVLLGALLGNLACQVAYSRPPSGTPSRSAKVVATAVTASLGVNLAESAHTFLAAPPGTGATKKASNKKEAIVTAACAFGNSLTLPLVFLAGVLSGSEADKAAGYLALYMTGWSPALWSVGYSIISKGDADKDSDDIAAADTLHPVTLMEQCLSFLGRVMNPPLYGVAFGILIGATPLSHFFFPDPISLSPPLGTTLSPLQAITGLTAGIFSPILEAADVLGSATLAVQTIVLASSLAESVPNLHHTVSKNFGSWQQTLISYGDNLYDMVTALTLNPTQPIGVDLDAPPAVILDEGRSLTRGSSPQAGRSLGVSGAVGVEREGSVGLVVSEERDEIADVIVVDGTPTRLLDGRSMWIISFVRFLALPVVNTALVLSLRAAHLIPLDPVLTLVLLVEGVMPPAQNLVLLAHLRPGTRALAGEIANLMLRSYAIAIIPITIWVAVFLALVPL